MRYPLVPPYAERREFYRPLWEALSAEIERIGKRVLVHGFSFTNALSAVEGAKTHHQSRLLYASPNLLHSKRRYWTQYTPHRSPLAFPKRMAFSTLSNSMPKISDSTQATLTLRHRERDDFLVILSCASVNCSAPMRFAGTCNKYSNSAMSKLISAAIHHGLLARFFRGPYHATIMKRLGSTSNAADCIQIGKLVMTLFSAQGQGFLPDEV